MAVDIVALALEFIAQYGLIAIFVLLVLDGALLLPVFPGELVLIMAVAAYATDPGELVFLVLLTSAAGLVGSLILYAITRGGGRRLVERYPKFFMMPRRRRERLERTFQRPVGQSLTLFLRLFPLTRVLVSIPAGLARMPLIRFVVLSTLGLTAYHAGFLWFTYEARRPGSTVATQAEQLQQAYASPAWDFVQANAIITGVVALGIGAVLSVRASRRAYHDPEESAGSLVGAITTAVLFWGGLALAVATYLDPESVYALVELGGLDMDAISAAVGYGPVPLLAAFSGTCILLGYLLARYRRNVQEHRKTRLAVHRALAEKEAAEREAVQRRVVFKATEPAEETTPWPDEAADEAGEPGVEGEPVWDESEWEWRQP